MDRPAPVAHPIAPLFIGRFSTRAYADRAVPDAVLAACLEAARWAPSCANEQPWQYLVARRHKEPDSFARLLDCLVPGNQAWAGRAPVLILSLARATFAGNGKPNAHAWHDVGMASVSLALEATAQGLQLRQMAGFDAAKARAAFAIPEGVDPVAAIALGYPGDPAELPEAVQQREAAPRTRKPIGDFTHLGAYGATGSI